MEREELLDFLREHLAISLSIDREFESYGEYIVVNVSLHLDGE